MSELPCELHGSPGRGQLLGVYVTLMKDGARFKNKKRVCQECMPKLLTMHANDWKDPIVHGPPDNWITCFTCGTVVNSEAELSRLYVTAYVQRDSRRDFRANLCSGCTAALIDEWDLKAA